MLYKQGFTRTFVQLIALTVHLDITMRECLLRKYEVRTVVTKSVVPRGPDEARVISRPQAEVAGHTSFLTFADLMPTIPDSAE